jgi:CTD small phosphatase-like protein 2
LQVE